MMKPLIDDILDGKKLEKEMKGIGKFKEMASTM